MYCHEQSYCCATHCRFDPVGKCPPGQVLQFDEELEWRIKACPLVKCTSSQIHLENTPCKINMGEQRSWSRPGGTDHKERIGIVRSDYP